MFRNNDRKRSTSKATRQNAPNPEEGLLNATGWYGYFPATRPESVLTTLHRLQGNRAYLIKLGGTWTEQDLDLFLLNTQAFAPGSTMNVRVKNPEKRAEIIDFLATLKD